MEQDIKKLVLGDCEVTDAGHRGHRDRGIGFAREHICPRTRFPTRQSAEEATATHVIGTTKWKKTITWQGTSLESSFDLTHIELKQEPSFAYTETLLRRERTSFDDDKGFSNAKTHQKKQRKASAVSVFVKMRFDLSLAPTVYLCHHRALDDCSALTVLQKMLFPV